MSEDKTMRHRDFLKSFAMFKSFHPNEVLLLARHMIEVTLQKGDVICRENDKGDSCFIVVFGKVDVFKELIQNKDEQLATLGSGQMFGQVSLIDGRPRSATCIAKERCLLLELKKTDFDRLFDAGESFAFRLQEFIARVMVRQLREADKKLTSMVHKARTMQVDLGEVFKDMVDALKSVEEMGVDLDDVTYQIAEGQGEVKHPDAPNRSDRSSDLSQRRTLVGHPAARPGRGSGEYSTSRDKSWNK